MPNAAPTVYGFDSLPALHRRQSSGTGSDLSGCTTQISGLELRLARDRRGGALLDLLGHVGHAHRVLRVARLARGPTLVRV